jgi:hypothetical protein
VKSRHEFFSGWVTSVRCLDADQIISQARKGETKERLSKPAFDFPTDETLSAWIKFINRKDYGVTITREYVSITSNRNINYGKSRVILNRSMKPIPTKVK